MTPQEVNQVVATVAAKYEPLITVEEAAAIARIPPKTIYHWLSVSSGSKLGALKVKQGRRVLLPRDAFVRFLLAEQPLN